ncbi:MAG: protein secretion chaperonin CsaA [Bacteroidetes bacterium]|nr:protein secretion chaperonin CsaA [Bacteroidota bacterium]
MKPTTEFHHFEALDIRVGEVVDVVHAATKKPAYRMTVNFGPEIGLKQSCGAYTNYQPGELIGKQVLAVVNFGVKKMGPELSEVLVLGLHGKDGETIYITPASPVALGEHLF